MLYLLINLFEVWLLISMSIVYDVLLFVYEFNLTVVKPLDVKTDIKFLSSAYEGKTDLLSSITQKIHIYSSFNGVFL